MRESEHHGFNALLRTTAADLIAGDSAWGLFGCYLNGRRGKVASLDRLNHTLAGALQTNAGGNASGLDAVLEATGALTADLPADAYGVQVNGLCGVVLIANFDDGPGARVLVAHAAFEDGYRHAVTWRQDEAAPIWEIRSPAARDSHSETEADQLGALLAVLQQARGSAPIPQVSEAQQQLNAELRAILGDRVTDQGRAVFIILATANGWEVIPPNDLVARFAAKLDAGASPRIALEDLADELEACPEPAIPICRGVGIVTHGQTEHGKPIAVLGAYCDGCWHSITWAYQAAAPEWEITPGAADTDLADVVVPFSRLTDAIRGIRN